MSALLALRTLSELTLRAGGRQESEMPKSRPLKFQPVPRLRRQREGDRLAPFNIDVPVGKLVVIVTARQPRAVVDARPGCFRDTVIRPVHPLPEVTRIRELTFTAPPAPIPPLAPHTLT